MTDAHNPRVLSDADSAADLAGLPRPSDMPSVGTEEAQDAQRDAWIGGSSYEAAMLRELLANIHRDGGHYVARHGLEKALSDAHTVISQLRCAALVSERDALAVRVRELEQDAQRLDWLDKNAGHHTVHVGGRWYVRRDYSAQHVRAGSLRSAIDAALTQQEKTNG